MNWDFFVKEAVGMFVIHMTVAEEVENWFVAEGKEVFGKSIALADNSVVDKNFPISILDNECFSDLKAGRKRFVIHKAEEILGKDSENVGNSFAVDTGAAGKAEMSHN